MEDQNHAKTKLRKIPYFWWAIVFGVLSIYTLLGALYGTTENAFIISEDQIKYGTIPTGVLALLFLGLTIRRTRAKK